MRRRKIALRVVIVAATVAACFGHALHLASTEQAQVTLPSSVAFGNVTIGAAPVTQAIMISPASGEQSDTVTAISTTACQAGFTVNPGALPATVRSTCTAGSGTDGICDGFTTVSYSFTATFSPTIAAPVNCTVLVTISGVVHTITLTGTGQLPPIDIAIETGGTECNGCTHPFGEVNLTRDATPLPVTIRNQGGGNAMVTSIVINNPPGMPNVFHLASGNINPVTLGANGTKSFELTCTPSALGAVTGSLVVNSNDPAGPRTLGLACTGVESALDTSLTTLTVTTRIGEPATFPPTPLQLNNIGTGSLTFTSITVIGDDLSIQSGPQNGQVVQAQQAAAPMTLRFAPTKAASGPLGTLRIQFDSGMRELPITGEAQRTTMSLSTNGQFGAVCGGAATTKPYMLLADSEGGFVLRGISVPSPFSVVPVSPNRLATPQMPITLEGGNGNNVTFDLVLDLTGVPTPPETVSGEMVFSTDIPVDAPAPIALSATVLQGGVSATVAGSAERTLDFGTVDVGNLSSTREVTITNCTTATLDGLTAEIVGDTAFKIAVQPAPIPMAKSDEYALQFLPASPGPKFATLRIAQPAGAALEVPLLGNGNGGLDDPDPGRGTYYNCSAGGSAGFGAGLLVVFAGLRRRRRK